MRFLSVPSGFSFGVVMLFATGTTAIFGQASPSSTSPAPSAVAASAPKAPAEAEKYAAEPMIIQKAVDLIVVKADGTGSRQQTVNVKVQTDAALRSLGVLNISFASASEHVTFDYVRTRHKDGSVTETPASNAIEQPAAVTKEAPFYSDLKEAQLPVKDLRVGDTLEWQYTVVRTRAEAPNQSWGAENFGGDNTVLLDESIELHAPKQLEIKVWTNPHLKITPTESVVGEEKVWRWTHQQLKPTAGADVEAAKKAKKGKPLTEDEIKDEDEGAMPAVGWSTFHNWEEIGNWYRTLAAKRAVPDDEIRAQANELTAGLKTQDEKIRAIYAYVSTKIRYIGVAFGVGRFQPHDAADVLHNQYGDCKDKQTLMAALLNAIGIPSDAALIGSGIRFIPELPSPSAFNHLIGRVTMDGKPVWLDPTEEVAPPGMMFEALRNKNALVIPPTGQATIVKTVADIPFPSEDTWTAKGSLNADGISESHIVTTWRGDEELIFRSALKSVSPSQYEEVVQHFANSFGYAGTTSHADISRPDDTSTPLRIAFDYHREKGGDWDNLRIIPQMGPTGIPGVDASDPPIRPIKLGTTTTLLNHAEMTLPEGWTATLPEAIHQKSRWATYDLTYRMENGTLITDRKVVFLQTKVLVADWQEYQKFANAVNEQYVILHRKGMQPTRKSATDPQKEKRLQELGEEAQSAWKAKDYDLLERIVKKMKSVDPDGERVHAWQASGYVMRGKFREAYAEDQKELDLYPEELDRYSPMTWLAERMKDKQLVIDTLTKWHSVVPENADVTSRLSYALLDNGEPAAAATMLEAALKHTTDGSPDNMSLRTQLGNAQLKAGQTQAGEDTVKKVIESTDDAMLLNNTAYALSEANIDLTLAEKAAMSSVTKQADASNSWTLDEDFDTLRGKSGLQEATWDTLAWIYFREQKLKEAYAWLAPVFLLRPDQTITDHLTQIKAAMKAANLPLPADTTTVKNDQQRRTLALDNLHLPKQAVEFHLLLQKGHVVRVTAVGEAPTGAEEEIRKLDFSSYQPPDSTAKIVLNAFLNCVDNKCSVVLAP